MGEIKLEGQNTKFFPKLPNIHLGKQSQKWDVAYKTQELHNWKKIHHEKENARKKGGAAE